MSHALHRKLDELRAAEVGPCRFGEGGPFRVCLVYPAPYAIGMSNLGMQVNLARIRAVPGITCERAFLPDGRWLTPDERSRPPILSMETHRPLADFHVIAFTLTYELDYLNVVRILKAAGVPALSEERGADSPLVIAGGAAVTANPAPLEPIVDAFWLGESEGHVESFFRALGDGWGTPRLRESIATHPHVYVPGVNSYRDVYLGVRQVDLDTHPAGSVLVTPHTVFSSRALLEITRGCKWPCRFCIARTLYGPVRHVRPQTALGYARRMKPYTGRLGLFGAGISDYEGLEDLVGALVSEGHDVSVSSLRISNLTPGLLSALEGARQTTVTVAPESFSPRLLRRLSKGLNTVLLHRGLEDLVESRIRRVKVYMMLGIPEEDDTDLALIRSTLEPYSSRAHQTWDLSFSILEPKPHTPLEAWRLAGRASVEARIRYLRRHTARTPRVEVSLPSFRETYLCDWLARGDPQVGRRIARDVEPSLEVPFRLGYEEYLESMDRILSAPQLPWALDPAPASQAVHAPDPPASAAAGRPAHPLAVIAPRERLLPQPQSSTHGRD